MRGGRGELGINMDTFEFYGWQSCMRTFILCTVVVIDDCFTRTIILFRVVQLVVCWLAQISWCRHSG